MITHEKFEDLLNVNPDDCIYKHLFIDVNNFDDVCSKISSYSREWEKYGYESSEIEGEEKSGEYKMKGDLFEIFAEIFFKVLEGDNRIGVYNYNPVDSDDDNGVDGFGKSIDSYPITVQVKFRNNPTYELKERDIKQFPYKSIIQFNVDPKTKNMVVFTNCKGFNWYTESNVFEDNLRVITGEMIKSIIDNNGGFWHKVKEIIDETMLEQYGQILY